MKNADKLQRQREAAFRDMPVTILLCIMTCAGCIMHGAEGGGVVRGVRIPAFELPRKDLTWAKTQAAKITRWATACLELYGFDLAHGNTATWSAARRKMDRVTWALKRVIPIASDSDYWPYSLAQMAILECCWQSVMVYRGESRRQAKFLLRTMRTMSDKYIAEESDIDWQMTKAYMQVSDYLTDKEQA